MKARAHRAAGMTLLEIMIAMAIMAIMLALGWMTFSGAMLLKNDSEDINERYHEIRVALDRMVNDLSSAYLSKNLSKRELDDPNLLDRRTLFVGKEDTLRFSSLAHRVFWADANESEQTLIAYFVADDREESSQKNLIRRESRRLSNEKWESEPGDVDVLVRNIESVSLEYYDWREKMWQKEWDSTGADKEKGRLPTRVRIVLELPTGTERTIRMTSQARILMQEELQFFAN